MGSPDAWNTDPLQFFDNPKWLELYGFTLDRENAQTAIQTVLNNYDGYQTELGAAVTDWVDAAEAAGQNIANDPIFLQIQQVQAAAAAEVAAAQIAMNTMANGVHATGLAAIQAASYRANLDAADPEVAEANSEFITARETFLEAYPDGTAELTTMRDDFLEAHSGTDTILGGYYGMVPTEWQGDGGPPPI